MSKIKGFFLACSVLTPLGLSGPALAASDIGLRGAILSDQSDPPQAAHKSTSDAIEIGSLDFAAAHDNAASVDYLAAASTSTGYSKSARQIANSMGFLGNANGAGVIIGIVDTGIQRNHPQFLTAAGTSRVLTGACFAGFSTTLCATADNKIGGDDLVWPVITHGTHVAGIAAGLTDGLASSASLLPVRVCDSATGACPGDIDAGILWASQHGAKVINLSLGGSTLSSRDLFYARAAVANGALLVVAAGNAGNSTPAGGFLAGAALYDGVRGNLIVVGALDATNHIAWYSQTPGNTCLAQTGGTYCLKNYFVVAPGSAIYSSVGGSKYAYLTGTSMATPYVSGVAADIKSMWPYLTMSQVATVILGTTIDLGAPGPDPVYGMGVVDLAHALQPAAEASLVTGGSNVTSSPQTVTHVFGSSSSGVMSAALTTSSLLKNVIVIDKFDRTYSADLTKAVHNDGYDVSSFVLLDQLLSAASAPGTVQTGLRAVASEGYSPQLGLVTMSGLVNTITTPAAFASGSSARDVVHGYVTNLAVSASPFGDVSFDMGYKLRLSGRLNEYDTGASAAYSGLFLSASALNSPYASLTDGGSYAGTTISLADGLDVRTGYTWMDGGRPQPGLITTSKLDGYTVPNVAGSYDQRTANAAVISAAWRFADWGGLGVVASQTRERNGILGGVESGALNLARSADTSAIDASLRFDLGPNLIATVAYGEGLTHLNVQPDGLLSSTSALRSRSYGIALATRNVFGDDSLGLALTRPMQLYGGNGTLTAATAVDSSGNLTIGHEQVSFASSTPETDLEVGYTKAFLDGRLSLQSDAAYQLDVGGQSGRNAATFVTRLRLGL